MFVLYIAVHADDLGIAASNKALMKEVVVQVNAIYQCVEGGLEFYLGHSRVVWIVDKPMEPESESNTRLTVVGIHLIQSKMVSTL